MKKQTITVQQFFYKELAEKNKMKEMKKLHPQKTMFQILAFMKEKDKAAEAKETPKVKKLTFKQRAKIKASTEAKYAELLALPAPPVSSILPAPKLRSMNFVQICSYVADKYPRISVVTAYADANPAVADVEAISDALLPYANMDRGDITSAEKLERDTLYSQLIENFNNMINSCANLSNGNALMFALTGVATRRPATRNHQQLPPTVFRLNLKKGGSKVGVSCKKVRYAKSYTVYYGPGATYDAATWKSKVGTTRILISSLPAGELYGFVMVANTGTTEGQWANIQTTFVPFN